MANRADRADQAVVTDFGKEHRPLTERDGVKLRQEVLEPTVRGDEAATWSRVTSRWRTWFKERREAALVFENDAAEQCTGPQETRFHRSYSERLYAKLKDLERGLSDAYGRRFSTALLTLTASSGRPGAWVPPADHLNDLLGSWEAVRRALHRVLDEERWEYLMVLEPHESGYAHVHVAVFVDGVVAPDRFEPVIDAHLRNCGRAERDAHQYGDVITVKRVAQERDRDLEEIGNLGSYLGEYLGIYDGDPMDAPDHVQRFNALLWATGRQQWRPSNGAQDYMAYDPPQPSGWELVGVTYDGGETVEPVNPDGGGVEWRETRYDRPPPAA
jgi:hypothetical protein